MTSTEKIDRACVWQHRAAAYAKEAMEAQYTEPSRAIAAQLAVRDCSELARLRLFAVIGAEDRR